MLIVNLSHFDAVALIFKSKFVSFFATFAVGKTDVHEKLESRMPGFGICLFGGRDVFLHGFLPFAILFPGFCRQEPEACPGMRLSYLCLPVPGSFRFHAGGERTSACRR